MNKKSFQMARRINLRIKIFTAIISPVLFFGLAEMGLRLSNFQIDIGRYIKQPPPYLQVDPQLSNGTLLKDPILFWRLSNMRKDVNSLGFRDIEFSVKKDKETFRIMCMGGSVTFGHHVPVEDTYPNKLEKILNIRFPARRFEVINAGVEGYTSYQGLRYLERDIIKYQPDLITIHFGYNDGAEAIRFEDKERKMQPDWLINLQNFLIRSRLYQLLNEIIFIFKCKFFGQESMLFKERKIRVSLQDYIYNLEKMADFCRRHNIKIVFIPPILYQNNRVFVFEECDLPKDNNAKIDLLTRFLKEEKLGELFLDNDNCHLTVKGHQIMAEEIADTLIREGIVAEE